MDKNILCMLNLYFADFIHSMEEEEEEEKEDDSDRDHHKEEEQSTYAYFLIF